MSPVSDSDVLGAWAWPREHLHRVPEILLLAQCCLLGITVFTHTMYKGEKSLDSSMFCSDADSVTLHADILGDPRMSPCNVTESQSVLFTVNYS